MFITYTITYTIDKAERAKVEKQLQIHTRNRDCQGQTPYGIEYYGNRVAELNAILTSGKRTVPCVMPSAQFMTRIAEEA